MNIFNLTHNELEDLGFTRNPEEIEEINSIGCVLYTNSKFNILVKYFTNPKEEIIREESIRLREQLFYSNFNVWNSYYIVCVNDSVSKDFTYLLEKDTKGLRKYVVKSKKDFDRIPIFDKTKSTNDFSIKFKTNDHEISNILEIVKKHKGLETNFNTQKVNDIIQEIIQEEK
ncbi:hypothetical protein U2I53_03015 [Lysinibacillus capsici]|uniref:ABC-three component system middle component 1 n=1 Tax=Lysinibacillus capsici TaxID=2115968 RepID=UPI0032E0356F